MAVDLPQSTARKERVHETTKRIPEESETPHDYRAETEEKDELAAEPVSIE